MARMDLAAKTGLALALLAGLAAPGAARAAGPTAKQRAAVLQAVVDCRAVADVAARVACYDAAVDKLDQAEASGDVVVVDREEASKVRREVFGLQLPSLDVFGRASGEKGAGPDLDRITETVKAASRGPEGRWVLELRSGAVWLQIDNSSLSRDPHPGSTVEIRKASLGSFMLKVDGQPAFKAHRDR